MLTDTLIAIDWGTSNRRIVRIENGVAVASESDAQGVSAFDPQTYEAELASIRARLGDLPVLIAGMAGSDLGWRAVPYVDSPAGLDALAAGLLFVQPNTAIVPGVCTTNGNRVDVMRGEEVQILGALEAGLIPPDALVCQPGTHNKWARVESGLLASFSTAITGELFALLRDHSILSGMMGRDVVVGQAFNDGVIEGAQRDLAASLFQVRARVLRGVLAAEHAASFASGILLGGEVAARIDALETVFVIGNEQLGLLYATAIRTLGGTAQMVDARAAFVSGMSHIWERVK